MTVSVTLQGQTTNQRYAPTNPPFPLPPTPIVRSSRWIEKDDLFKQTGHEWEVADWELFQMEYFKAGIASTFLPKLARQLEETFIGHKDKSEVKGIAVRVVAAGTTETEELREAVNKAASGLNGDVSRNVTHS